MSLADNIDISLFPARFGAVLLGVFGFLALLIASIGIYGVMAYFVQQNMRDIGIRLALGGTPSVVVNACTQVSGRNNGRSPWCMR